MRRPDFSPTSLPDDMTGKPLVRELNRRFGLVGQAFASFSVPFALTYGASIAIDARAATYFRLIVANGSAFTFQNPTFLAPGQPLILDILNSSGGAMGVITWGSFFLRDASWVNPANTKRRVIWFTAVSISSLVQSAPATGDI
jgi:hypothetical protein